MSAPTLVNRGGTAEARPFVLSDNGRIFCLSEDSDD
jgi:hypothetical protein